MLRGQRPSAETKKAKPRQRGFASCGKERREVSEVGFEKGLDPVEGDDVHPVVQVRMRGPGHDHQFLVVTAELLEGILAEVAGMGLFPVDQQDRAADLARIGQQRHVQEGQGRGGVPGTIGVDGTGMEAAPGLVIIEVILDELRLVARQGLGQACGGRYFVIPSYQADYTVAGVQRMADYFNRVGRVAAEYGLKLGYHNHSGEFTQLADSNAVMWEYLVEHTDPAYVCFELDVYWCSKGGKSPVEYLRKYPDRIEMLHIKDDFVIGASGTIDFKGIFEQFYANGMKDYVVEIETPGWLREKKNADGTPYSQEQIMDEMFQAAAESADWLSKADFVK